MYRINVATHEWKMIPLLSSGDSIMNGREINSLSISEDGTQMMLSTTRRVNLTSWIVDDSFCHDEKLEWISIDGASGASPGTSLKVVDLPQGKACAGWVEAGGTVSPFVGKRSASGLASMGRSISAAAPSGQRSLPRPTLPGSAEWRSRLVESNPPTSKPRRSIVRP